MVGRLAIVALATGLAGCAGMEPAGRNARHGPAATAPVSVPAPTRAQPPAPLPPPQTATATAPPLVVPRPPPAATAPAAPPVIQRTQVPTPAPQAPPVAAPQVSVPTPPPPQPAAAQSSEEDSEQDIVVPGQVRTQVPPPAGDPRTNEERRADVRAWDQCVTQVQSAFDADPMRPQLTTPEEYCAQSLGMPDRTSVPISRRQRR